MGIFDDIKNTADAHEAEVEAGIDRVGDAVDERTGGQFIGQVDDGQEFLKGRIGEPVVEPDGSGPNNGLNEGNDTAI